jgi:hypothetical protein
MGGAEAPRQIHLTRRMREAIEFLRNSVGTPAEVYAKHKARLALSGDFENWYRAGHNRLCASREAAGRARLARRIERKRRK